ncbi:acyl-CoA-binding protein-like [Bradysia coprophila]|uniref:acyl-CoA-binding protein-like n=1 Tax=Bradysia coprophila TaxID=38358 RepID=UPI00187DD0DF|nr:acyl-CoA-binding protein-like [Bradysia coprophila]
MEDKIELERNFSKAATKARAMTNRKLLSEEERAELLGLFKQGTMGDGNVWKMFKEKNFLVSDTTNVAKNVNWLGLRGMSQIEAKQKYIDLVDELMEKYCVVFPPTRYGSMASLSSACTTYTYVPPARKASHEV